MIENWNFHSLKMDFSSMETEEHHQPSDIDMFYLSKNEKTLILGEIKNENGTFTEWQRHLYETIATNWNGTCIVLYITHDKQYQKGDRVVDIGNCYVKSYYYKGKWRTPKTFLKVHEVIDRYA